MNNDFQVEADSLGKYPGFSCFKTFSPVRYSRRWFRSALVLAALDAHVLRMGPSPVAADTLPVGTEFCFWVQTEHECYLQLVSSFAFDIGEFARKVPARLLDRLDLVREPRASLARQIWSCQRIQLHPDDEYLVTRTVLAHEDGVPFDDLFSLLDTSETPRLEVIFSMIARGYLETDIASGLTPETLVWAGPMTRQRNRPIASNQCVVM